MAEGGSEDLTNSDSLQHGCDFLYDYTCTLCDKDRKNTEAVKYCTDCAEYLCKTCLIAHSRFGRMRAHNVVDPASQSTVQRSSDVHLITMTCSKHNKKVLDMFCGDHDEIGCSECINVYHSTCTGISYIPDISKGFKKSDEYERHRTEKKDLMSQLEVIKDKRTANLELLEIQKEAIIERFRQAREDMIKRFDDLEQRSIDIVENKFEQNVSCLNDEIERIDVVHDTLTSSAGRLKKEQSETQAFVFLKTEKNYLNEIKDLVKKLRSKNSKKLEYKLNEKVSNYLVDLKALGSFTSNKVKSKVFNIKAMDDKYCCNVKGLCQLDDGTIVITDAANMNIKRFGPSFANVEKCEMPSQPWSVCTFTNSEIAVSLCSERSIQFVTVKGKMQLSRSFKVNETCTGLTSFGNTLYVGAFNKKEIHAYSQYGRLVKRLDLTIGKTGYEPWSIATLLDLPFIYVASRTEGVISVHVGKEICEKIEIPGLMFANSIAVSENGHVFVSCNQSNTIFFYSGDGRCQTLLTKADEISAPQALLYSRRHGLIVASTDTDTLRVYPNISQTLV